MAKSDIRSQIYPSPRIQRLHPEFDPSCFKNTFLGHQKFPNEAYQNLLPLNYGHLRRLQHSQELCTYLSQYYGLNNADLVLMIVFLIITSKMSYFGTSLHAYFIPMTISGENTCFSKKIKRHIISFFLRIFFVVYYFCPFIHQNRAALDWKIPPGHPLSFTKFLTKITK